MADSSAVGRIKDIASRVALYAVLAAVLLIGMKGCVVSIWKSPKEPTTYAIHGDDGRSLVVTLMPGNKALIVHSDARSSSIEAVLASTKGIRGTHYIWRLWGVRTTGSLAWLFGFRIYPDGTTPVEMETTILRKFVHGNIEQALRNEGDVTRSTYLFTDQSIKFGDMWLYKEPTNKEVTDILIGKLSQ